MVGDLGALLRDRQLGGALGDAIFEMLAMALELLFDADALRDVVFELAVLRLEFVEQRAQRLACALETRAERAELVVAMPDERLGEVTPRQAIRLAHQAADQLHKAGRDTQ